MRACAAVIGVLASVAGSIRVLKVESGVENEVVGEVAEEYEANQTAAEESAYLPTALEREAFQIVQNLRASGFRCPATASRPAESYPANRQRQIMDCRLVRASRLHSQDMANRGYFSHTGLDGRGPTARARDAGFPGQVGENIAAGRGTAAAAIDQWKGSKTGHCNALMNPRNRLIGIGYGRKDGSRYTHYWTMKLHSGSVAPDVCLA